MEKLFNSDRASNLFIVNEHAALDSSHSNALDNTAAEGTLRYMPTIDDKLVFEYKGKGTVTRTDVIDPKFVKVTSTSAEKQRIYAKAYKVQLEDPVNYLVPSEVYTLDVQINNFFYDAKTAIYNKVAAVTCLASMDANDFYIAMAKSLQRVWEHEKGSYLDFYLTTTAVGSPEPLSSDGKTLDLTSGTYFKFMNGNEVIDLGGFSGTATGIIIAEHEQPDDFYLKEQQLVDFEVFGSEIEYNSVNVHWDKIVKTGEEDGSGFLGYACFYENGKTVARMEYDFWEAKGIFNRDLRNWPLNHKVEYVADPTLSYDCVNITYEFGGNNFSSLHSFKEFIFFVPKDQGGTEGAAGDALKTAIETMLQTL